MLQKPSAEAERHLFVVKSEMQLSVSIFTESVRGLFCIKGGSAMKNLVLTKK